MVMKICLTDTPRDIAEQFEKHLTSLGYEVVIHKEKDSQYFQEKMRIIESIDRCVGGLDLCPQTLILNNDIALSITPTGAITVCHAVNETEINVVTFSYGRPSLYFDKFSPSADEFGFYQSVAKKIHAIIQNQFTPLLIAQH